MSLPDDRPDPTRPVWSETMDTDSTLQTHLPTHAPADESGRHPVNLTHLILGVAFLGFAGLWAVVTSDAVSDEDLRWLLPVPWLLAGSAGLLAITISRVRRTRRVGVAGGDGEVGVVGDDRVDTSL